MSQDGMRAARQLVMQVSDLVVSLTPQEWQLPSGCAGWRVQDVIAHLGSGAHSTVEPQAPINGLTAEQQMEAIVAARREWSAERVAQEYLDHAMPALDIMESLQEQPQAQEMVPLLDLGTYPLSILPDVVTFDHYCHLHVDLLAPHGPLDRAAPPAGADILRPAIGWMLHGLPQMQRHELDVLTIPLVLQLTGPGGGTWVLTPAAHSAPITVHPLSGAPDPAATLVRSSTADFVRWATGRASWRELADVTGQRGAASPFLDRLNII